MFSRDKSRLKVIFSQRWVKLHVPNNELNSLSVLNALTTVVVMVMQYN